MRQIKKVEIISCPPTRYLSLRMHSESAWHLSLMSSSAIVRKLWNYCNVLRDDRMSYGDYVERITSISQGCQQGISTGRPA